MYELRKLLQKSIPQTPTPNHSICNCDTKVSWYELTFCDFGWFSERNSIYTPN